MSLGCIICFWTDFPKCSFGRRQGSTQKWDSSIPKYNQDHRTQFTVLTFIKIRVINTSGFLQQFCRTGSTDPTRFSSEYKGNRNGPAQYVLQQDDIETAQQFRLPYRLRPRGRSSKPIASNHGQTLIQNRAKASQCQVEPGLSQGRARAEPGQSQGRTKSRASSFNL